MPLPPGSRLGAYEIIAAIGAGAMGEVYKARDERLGRDVAIKVLPELLTSDPDRRLRFEREARTIAALDHPSIVTIYSVEEDRGTVFITMQLVQGRTLAEAIPANGLSLRRFFEIAVPLVDAIGAAHQREIVHRDVKPANVMVTDDGRVKVLDFGVAKLRGEAGNEDAVTMVPTHVTATGQIIGTVAYMAPEQAEGRQVDRRSDIFSLGVVLYEMATGIRPFQGDGSLSTLTSILRDTPRPITAVNPALPHHLARIVRRCLEKDPGRRYESAIDLRNDLEDLDREIQAGGPSDTSLATIKPRHVSRIPTLIAASTALAVGVAGGIWIDSRSNVSSVPRSELALRQVTANPLDVPLYGAAISPDGRYLAYTDATGLFLRALDSGETHPVSVAEPWRFWDVAWFPDGTKLLVTGPSASGETMDLYSISPLGGTPRKLQDDVWRAAVSPDGSAIAFIHARYPIREVWLMGADGEQPRRLVQGAPGDTFWQVGWSPNNRRILYGKLSRGPTAPSASIQSVGRDGQTTTTIMSDPLLFQNWRGILPFSWLPKGRFVLARREPQPNTDSSNLWELQVDENTGVPRTIPRRLTQLGNYNVRDIRATLSGTRLTLLRERNQGDIYIAPFGSRPPRLGVPHRLTLDDRDDEPGQWTPDAKTIVFQSKRASGWSVFKQGVGELTAEPVVIGAASQPYPRVTPDGRWILYMRDGNLSRVPVAGGPPEVVLQGQGPLQSDCAKPPSTRCVISELLGSELTFSDLDALRGRGRELRRFATSSPDFTNWRLSPDGERIALVDFSDRVRLFDLAGGPVRDLSVPSWTAFEFVTWAADGQAVFVTGFSLQGPRLTNTGILRVDINGHADVLRHEPNEWHVYPVASPDGKSMAIGTMKLESNAWMIDGF